MYISIGPNCHPAGILRLLKLRTVSMPFDWMLIEEEKVFEYINIMINTNFCNFTENLKYNNNKKVVSNFFEYAQFFHFDLIQNKCDKIAKCNDKNLMTTMKNRANRFMTVINNLDNEVFFLCMLHHTNIYNEKLFNNMIEFDNNKNIKCKFKVLVYFYNDNDDFILNVPEKFQNLKHFFIKKFIRNKSIHKIYGSKSDFLLLLNSIKEREKEK